MFTTSLRLPIKEGHTFRLKLLSGGYTVVLLDLLEPALTIYQTRKTTHYETVDPEIQKN